MTGSGYLVNSRLNRCNFGDGPSWGGQGDAAMTDITLMTATKDPATVLPALAVLSHRVRVLPPVPVSIQKMPEYTILFLDARTDLARSKAMCRMIHTARLAIPIILILTEGGFTAVNSEWGVSELILASASPAEVEARIRLMNELGLRRLLSSPAAQKTGASVPGAGTLPGMPGASAGATGTIGGGTGAGPRQAGPGDSSPAPGAGAVLVSGDLRIDEQGYSVSVRGHAVKLAYKEFELLNFLARHPGRAFTRNQLLQSVWGYDYYGGTRTVDVHVRRLRVKLGKDEAGMISTVRNVGYRYDPFIDGRRADGEELEKARAQAARARAAAPDPVRRRTAGQAGPSVQEI